MNKYCITFIYLHLYLNYGMEYPSKASNENCLKYVLQTAIDEIEPYQVIIFIQEYNRTEYLNYIKMTNLVIKYVSIEKAVIVTRISTLKYHKKYFHLLQPLVKDPRATSLFISVFTVKSQNENTQNNSLLITEFEKIFKFLIKLSPGSIRPRCLFIINVRNSVSTIDINRILRYAWNNQFLDITIVQFISDDKSHVSVITFHSYNPFTDSYTSACSPIFPNKLNNMFGYELSAVLLKRHPAVNFDRDSVGYPVNISGSDHWLMETWMNTLNFTIRFLAPHVSGYGEPVLNDLTPVELITRGDIDFSGNQIYLHLVPSGGTERTRTSWTDPFVILVPVIPRQIVSINALLGILVVFGHIGGIYLMARIWNFSVRHWRPHNILQMILGNTVPKSPNGIVERIVFVFLFLLSQEYSTKLYAHFTEFNLNNLDDGPFHSLEDLVNSDTVVETHKYYYNVTFNDPDDLLLRLRLKIRLVDDIMMCPHRILANRNVACLIDNSVAEAQIEQAGTKYVRMKVLKQALWNGPKGTVFAPASPYVLKFNKISQYMFETGTWWQCMKGRTHDSLNDETNEKRSSGMSLKMAAVCVSGCTVASVVFIVEMVLGYGTKTFKWN